MIYESHFKKNSLKIFLLYKSRTHQTVVDEDTFVVVSQACLVCGFFGLFFFSLSQVMTGTIWTDFCSTIFVFFVSRTV